jgi:hypothetical protein
LLWPESALWAFKNHIKLLGLAESHPRQSALEP